MPNIPKAIRALPDKTAYAFKAVGGRASGVGVNAFARNIVIGFFTSEIKKLRIDQAWTLLENGSFLADLIDEENIPSNWNRAMRVLGKIMGKETLTRRLDDLITPELMMNAIRETRPDVFKLIIESGSGGPKWFYDQTFYMNQKLHIIIERVLN